MNFDPAHDGLAGWPEEAIRVLDRAEERHGGRALWRRVRSISLSPTALGGPLPWAKGHGRTHHLPPRAEIFPAQRRAVFFPYPEEGQRGIFENGDVRIETEAQVVLARDQAHRESFRGLRKLHRWDSLDALYFFGYAMVTYLGVPFILRQARFVEIRGATFRGEALRGVTVDFPDDFVTHSRRQTFFFDEGGLLRRHDYVADIVGSWARGSHFSDEYESVSGLLLAHRRWVVATLLGRPSFIPVLSATLSDFSVSLDPGV